MKHDSFLSIRPALFHNVPDLAQKHLNIFPRQSDEILYAVLPEVLTEGIETLKNVHDRSVHRPYESFPSGSEWRTGSRTGQSLHGTLF